MARHRNHGEWGLLPRGRDVGRHETLYPSIPSTHMLNKEANKVQYIGVPMSRIIEIWK